MAKRETGADRLRVALDLYELGEKLARARLRRQHPRASEAAIEAMYVKQLYAHNDARWPTALRSPSRRSRKT